MNLWAWLRNMTTLPACWSRGSDMGVVKLGPYNIDKRIVNCYVSLVKCPMAVEKCPKCCDEDETNATYGPTRWRKLARFFVFERAWRDRTVRDLEAVEAR